MCGGKLHSGLLVILSALALFGQPQLTWADTSRALLAGTRVEPAQTSAVANADYSIFVAIIAALLTAWVVGTARRLKWA